MKLRVFGISDNATLEPLSGTTLSVSWLQDDVNRWIDIEDATLEELRNVLEPLELNTIISDACLQPDRVDRIVSTQNSLYMELPTHLGWTSQ